MVQDMPAIFVRLCSKIIGLASIGILALVLIIPTVCHAQADRSPQENIRAFFRSVIGEWIGTCEQTTDGEPADNKYFHAVVKQVDDSTFESRFEYFRLDKSTGAPIRAGETLIVTTLEADGIAKSKITGRGTVLVNNRPKDQVHELSEALICAGINGMEGQGSGTISVSGMPFGLGKNGKIEDSKSAWSLDGEIMTVHQLLKIGFRALFFTKHFRIAARYTASRGSDMVGLMKRSSLTAGADREQI